MKNNRFNLLNKKFDDLEVVGFEGIIKGHRHWKCLCSCGNFITLRGASLVHGNTKSCGCLHKKVVGDTFRTHGKAKSKEYRSWQHLKERCLNPKDPAYFNYGGRGITVCDEWKDSFEKFYEDMGECPKNYSIERIDNEKGYYKENCKWASREEQSLNRRNTVIVTFNNETKPLLLFCKELNLKYFTVIKKLKRGLSVEDAFKVKTKIN